MLRTKVRRSGMITCFGLSRWHDFLTPPRLLGTLTSSCQRSNTPRASMPVRMGPRNRAVEHPPSRCPRCAPDEHRRANSTIVSGTEWRFLCLMMTPTCCVFCIQQVDLEIVTVVGRCPRAGRFHATAPPSTMRAPIQNDRECLEASQGSGGGYTLRNTNTCGRRMVDITHHREPAPERRRTVLPKKVSIPWRTALQTRPMPSGS